MKEPWLGDYESKLELGKCIILIKPVVQRLAAAPGSTQMMCKVPKAAVATAALIDRRYFVTLFSTVNI